MTQRTKELTFDDNVAGKPLIHWLGNNRKQLAALHGLSMRQIAEVEQSLGEMGHTLGDGPAFANWSLDPSREAEDQMIIGGRPLMDFRGKTPEQILLMVQGHEILRDCVLEARDRFGRK